jgi:hypothetical protein
LDSQAKIAPASALASGERAASRLSVQENSPARGPASVTRQPVRDWKS